MSNYDSLIVESTFCNDTNEFKSFGSPISEKSPSGNSHYIYKYYNTNIRLDYSNKNIKPTFTCYENNEVANGKYFPDAGLISGGKYSSKVGTLTADDVIFAGAISSYVSADYNGSSTIEDKRNYDFTNNDDGYNSNTRNLDFYLKRNNEYLTMSKAYENCEINVRYDTRDCKYASSRTNYMYYFYTDNQYTGYLKRDEQKAAAVYPVINLREDAIITNINDNNAGTESNPYIVETDMTKYKEG